MIKVNKGTVEIEGSESTIKAEVTLLLKSLVSDNVGFTNKDIDNIVAISRMNPDEIMSKVKERLKSMSNDDDVLKILKSVLLDLMED